MAKPQPPRAIEGTNDDPEFRRERARLGAAAVNSVDGMISRLAKRAPRFTDNDVARLRALVASLDGGAQNDG